MLSNPLQKHLAALHAGERCPQMHRPSVVGREVASRILLVGQAPGDKEPLLGRPFAWTAGKTLFKWFAASLGWTEDEVRERIYFAAVCRCFPGKNPRGGDRVPAPDEIENCSHWLEREFELLRPTLVLPVGKLAITQFLPVGPL
jgi:uracil-DNA glycosylase